MVRVPVNIIVAPRVLVDIHHIYTRILYTHYFYRQYVYLISNWPIWAFAINRLILILLKKCLFICINSIIEKSLLLIRRDPRSELNCLRFFNNINRDRNAKMLHSTRERWLIKKWKSTKPQLQQSPVVILTTNNHGINMTLKHVSDTIFMEFVI